MRTLFINTRTTQSIAQCPRRKLLLLQSVPLHYHHKHIIHTKVSLFNSIPYSFLQTNKQTNKQTNSENMNQAVVPLFLVLSLTTHINHADAFAVIRTAAPSSTTCLDASKIGIFFGTSTGNTESVAELLAEQLETDPPMDIDAVQGKLAETIEKYDALIVGTPTWNTGTSE